MILFLVSLAIASDDPPTSSDPPPVCLVNFNHVWKRIPIKPPPNVRAEVSNPGAEPISVGAEELDAYRERIACEDLGVVPAYSTVIFDTRHYSTDFNLICSGDCEVLTFE